MDIAIFVVTHLTSRTTEVKVETTIGYSIMWPKKARAAATPWKIHLRLVVDVIRYVGTAEAKKSVSFSF